MYPAGRGWARTTAARTKLLDSTVYPVENPGLTAVLTSLVQRERLHGIGEEGGFSTAIKEKRPILASHETMWLRGANPQDRRVWDRPLLWQISRSSNVVQEKYCLRPQDYTHSEGGPLGWFRAREEILLNRWPTHVAMTPTCDDVG